jgi:hypothetical protein
MSTPAGAQACLGELTAPFDSPIPNLSEYITATQAALQGQPGIPRAPPYS